MLGAVEIILSLPGINDGAVGLCFKNAGAVKRYQGIVEANPVKHPVLVYPGGAVEGAHPNAVAAIANKMRNGIGGHGGMLLPEIGGDGGAVVHIQAVRGSNP